MMDDPQAPSIPYIPSVPGIPCGISVNYAPGHQGEARQAAEGRMRHWLSQKYPGRTIATLVQTNETDEVMAGHPLTDQRAPRTLHIRYRVTFERTRKIIDLSHRFAELPAD